VVDFVRTYLEKDISSPVVFRVIIRMSRPYGIVFIDVIVVYAWTGRVDYETRISK
jgi:hypothetical protein